MNKYQILSALQERGFHLCPQVEQEFDEIPDKYDFPDGLILMAEGNNVVLATEPPQFQNSYVITHLNDYAANYGEMQVYLMVYVVQPTGTPYKISMERITVTEAETILLKEYRNCMAAKIGSTENQRLAREHVKRMRQDRYL